MTRVKFCGFTDGTQLRAALDLGVDAIGLNFARGPRRILPEQGAQLAALVPPLVQVVGLFVDADMRTMERILAQTRCNVVQLHGDEPPEIAAELRRKMPVIKAARIASVQDVERLRGYPADAFLLDAAVPGAVGGTGHTWDYRLLTGIDLGVPVMLAGGLHPDNVAAAIRAVHPWAVDVASGIEDAPAQKSPTRMAAFMAAVRSADA